MRKFLFAVSALMAATAAQAAYMYWQVDESAGGTWNTVLQDYNTKWKVPTEKQITFEQVEGAQLVQWNTTTGEKSVLAQVDTAHMYATQQANIDIVSLEDHNTYSYYIEIVSSAAQPYPVVARSQNMNTEPMTYQEMVTANAIYYNSELSVPSIKIWAGSGFSAAPEPTSGLLVLIGVGLLGLKRKRA